MISRADRDLALQLLEGVRQDPAAPELAEYNRARAARGQYVGHLLVACQRAGVNHGELVGVWATGRLVAGGHDLPTNGGVDRCRRALRRLAVTG